MTKIILCHEKVKMVKLSLCTTCKYIEGDEVQLYSFLTLVEDESGQLHAPVTLPLVKEYPVAIEEVAGWALWAGIA